MFSELAPSIHNMWAGENDQGYPFPCPPLPGMYCVFLRLGLPLLAPGN